MKLLKGIEMEVYVKETTQLVLSQLSSFEIDPVLSSITLVFSHGEEEGSRKVKCCGIFFMNISRFIEDVDGDYDVLEISVSSSDDGGRTLFDSNDYKIRKSNGEPFSVDGDVVHLHIDGGICIDILCETIEFYN